MAMSCKISQKLANNNSHAQIGNLNFPGERLYIKSELDTGLRICAALKKKRDFFQTLYDRTEKFNFQGTIVDCQGTTTLDSVFIATIGNASALEYSAITPRENYFRDIITDQSSAMNDLCTSMAASSSVLNTVKSGSLKYTVNFMIADNYDRFDILKEVSDGKGGFTASGAESISIITNTTQAISKFAGVEKERVRYTSCGNNKYQTLKQSWKGALTNF
jgi:hypothetical protein